MPDKHGRYGYNDFMGIAAGFRNIQAMGQSRITFDQQQEFNEDYENNLAALGAGPQTAKPYEVDGAYVAPDQLPVQPVELTGSERSKIAAKEDYSKGLAADLNITDKKMEADVTERSSGISAWIDSNPGLPLEKIPSNLTAGVVGQKAKANVIGLYGASAEAQKKFMEARIPIIREHAKEFFNTRKLVNDALAAGKTDMVVNGLVKMSKDLKLSGYQLGEFDPETKSFSVSYFDRRTGKLQKSGKKGLDEVVTAMNALGEKEFFGVMAAGAEAKRLENLKEEANPKHGKTSGGTATLINAQVKVMDQDGGVDITVRDERTGEILANYPSWDAFYDAGNSKENQKRDKATAEINSLDALASERNNKAALAAKQTAALGKGGKYQARTFYDDQGNSYTAKSQAMENEYRGNGWTIKNPKMNEGMYERSVKSFLMQNKGFVRDEESDIVSGIVTRDNYKAALKQAKDHNLSLLDESGVVIDTNGGWPGGKKEAFRLSVLPMGEKQQGGGDPAIIDDNVSKFDSDTKADPAAVADDKPVITQMSKDEIKDIYRFGFGDEPATTPLTAVQKLLSYNHSGKHELVGEGKIEKAIRDAGIETDLQKQKIIAKTLKSKFPDATEDQLVEMIKEAGDGKQVNDMATAALGRR